MVPEERTDLDRERHHAAAVARHAAPLPRLGRPRLGQRLVLAPAKVCGIRLTIFSEFLPPSIPIPFFASRMVILPDVLCGDAGGDRKALTLSLKRPEVDGELAPLPGLLL